MQRNVFTWPPGEENGAHIGHIGVAVRATLGPEGDVGRTPRNLLGTLEPLEVKVGLRHEEDFLHKAVVLEVVFVRNLVATVHVKAAPALQVLVNLRDTH